MTRETDDDPAEVVLGPAPATDPIAHRELLRAVEAGLFGHPLPPPRVGRYELVRRIGSGGQGVVYVAHDPELDRDVAVKLLLSDRAVDEDRQRLLLRDALTVTSAEPGSCVPPRLRREAQAMARLAHPNVAAVYEVGWHDGSAFVAMELVNGPTLRDWLDDGPRQVPEILHVLMQAGRGLEAAHAAGLVHRDFKPTNVMVTREGVAKVLDFGLATDIARDEEQHRSRADVPVAGRVSSTPSTRTGTVMGTPAYMAPEQRHGGRVDAKCDQFAYCVTLYEALWGHRPHAAGPHARGVPATVARPRRVPGWIEAVLRRGLSADPDARWPDMPTLLHALTTGASRRRGRIAWTSACAVLLALGSGGAWMHMQRVRGLAACAELGTSIQGEVWNADSKASTRAALVRSGVPDADAMHDRLVQHVDEWTDAWSEARTRTCEDADVHDRMPLQVAEAAHDCFEERRWALEELLTDLDSTGPSEAYRLLPAALGLPDIATCIDESVLLSRPRPSDDPSVRARVEGLRRELATVARLDDRGQPIEALARARDVLDEAIALQEPPLSALAHLVVGRLQHTTGAIADAERTLEAGLGIAMAASADDLVGSLLTELVFVVGYGAGRHEEAGRWGRLAQGWIERRGRGESLEAANLLNYLALVQREAGELPAAQATQEKALAIREGILGEHLVLSVSLVNLATIHGMQADYDRAEEAIARALAIQERALGSGHPDVASAVLVMANLQHLQGRGDEAVVLGRRALGIYEEAFGAEHPSVADAVTSLAVFHVEAGDLAAAEPQFRRALEIRERTLGPEHPQTASARSNLERVLTMQVSPPQPRVSPRAP